MLISHKGRLISLIQTKHVMSLINTYFFMQDGPTDYMIIDKHEVNYKPSGPHECDKIGVTYTAFRNQRPAGCQQKKGA